MSIRVNVNPAMQHLAGNQDLVEVSGKTVGECVNALIERYPAVRDQVLDKDGSVLHYIDIYVNGKSSYPEELAKSVKDGDELYILMDIGGG